MHVHMYKCMYWVCMHIICMYLCVCLCVSTKLHVFMYVCISVYIHSLSSSETGLLANCQRMDVKGLIIRIRFG